MENSRWYFGINLAPSSSGALRFARWLSTAAPDRYHLHGVYCVSTLFAMHRAAVAAGPDLTEHRQTLEHFVERFECEDAFASLEAMAGDADVVLRNLVTERGGDAIVVGRSAGIDATAIVSLGAIPRRVVRQSTVPVVVVPPDVPDARLSRGPVVVAVTPFVDSLAALRFAQSFATTHGRELRLVHVVPTATANAAHEPGADIGQARHEAATADATDTRLRLERWCREHGLVDPPLDIVPGRIANAVIEYARRNDASMIVCGSRRLSLLERIITSSQGSLIAAHADCAVAVVPPA